MSIKIGIDARSVEGQKTGVGRYLENLLKFWQNEQDCDFYLFFKNEIPDNNLFNSFNFKKIFKKTKSNFLFTHFVLLKLIKQYKCDIFFSPGYILPLLTKVSCALTLHDIIYEARPDLYNWQSKADFLNLKIVSKLSAQKAKIIFTPSQFTKNEVIKYYKINPEKIVVTPLAFDQRFNLSNLQSKISLDYDAKVINNDYFIFAGACFDRRHIKKVIFAVKKLKKIGYDIKLFIAGPDLTKKRDIAQIAQSINKFFHQDIILYKPYIDTEYLAVLYSKAKACIYISDYEGFGLPLIEAMAAGCPVITGPSQALVETAGKAALILQKISVDQIFIKLKEILDNENLRKNFILKGLERAKEFSWEKTAKITISQIKKLINNN